MVYLDKGMATTNIITITNHHKSSSLSPPTRRRLTRQLHIFECVMGHGYAQLGGQGELGTLGEQEWVFHLLQARPERWQISLIGGVM